MYGDQVVVPAVLTRKILKDFHTEHPGIYRTKAFMRSYVHCLGMDKDIEQQQNYEKFSPKTQQYQNIIITNKNYRISKLYLLGTFNPN